MENTSLNPGLLTLGPMIFGFSPPFLFIEKRSHYVAQAGLELWGFQAVLLPGPSKMLRLQVWATIPASVFFLIHHDALKRREIYKFSSFTIVIKKN